MKITEYFVRRHKLTNLIMLLIILLGIFSIVGLPRQDSPNINFDIMMITTFYPGASPEDVEINVTDLIEDELENVDGIEEMNSYSIEGMSAIYIELDADADDLSQVKDDIRSAVDRVSDLPKEVENRPMVDEMRSTDFPILEIAISGENIDENLLRRIAKDMETEIKAIGKVGTIDKIAYRKKEIKILCDHKKMESNYVSFSEVLNAIRARNVKVAGGTLESFVDEKKIVTFSEFERPMDVKEVIVRSNFSGSHIKVKDIAIVKDDFKDKDLILRTNGNNSINLIVKRRGTTDIINLSKKIDKVVGEYSNLYKNQGINIFKVVDFTYYTSSLLNIVINNAFIGFCLVLLCLFLTLNFHSAIWVAAGIPLSILAAYIFFPIVGITTNQITLITIIMVLGMLVDDAIVIAENINRHQEAGMNIIEASIIGTREMFKPVLATITTTILCFIPMYFMSGILGKFVSCIPTVIILALTMSLFESVTLLPVHLSMRKSFKHTWQHNWINWLKNHYERILKFFLNSRKVTVTCFIIFSFLIAVLFSKLIRFELFPTEDFDLFYIVMEAPMSTSLEETSKMVKEVEQYVSEIPKSYMMGYKTVVGNHMTEEAAADPSPHSNWALITVYLHPASDRDKRSEDIIDELKQKTKNINSFEKFDIRELQDGPPVGKPITIRLVSDNFKLCQKYEKKLLEFINTVDGVKDIETSNRPGKNELRLKLNYDYMAKLGITALDLADTIRVAYEGKVATSIRQSGEEIDFRVRLLDEQRRNPNIILNLQMLNRLNKLIKLKNFVKFEEGPSPQTITHFNGRKSITITGDVDSKKITSAKANKIIRKKFEKEFTDSSEISWVFGGEEKQSKESMENFFMAFIASLMGIYFILVLLLDSFLQPFIIMIAIPFGFLGVMFAFIVHGLPMSFIGMIGTLGMIGVVVNDSLVMVTYLNSQKKRKGFINNEIIISGAKTRLRPVLLTTFTTVFGLLPTVYGWGGTEPFLVPMVLAMSWGLVFATIVTLILIPLFYSFTVKHVDNTHLSF